MASIWYYGNHFISGIYLSHQEYNRFKKEKELAKKNKSRYHHNNNNSNSIFSI